jgi:hypothetical protein
VGSLQNVNPKKDLRPPFFGSFFGRAKNEQIIFGRTKKEHKTICANKNMKLFTLRFSLFTYKHCALFILYPFPIPFPYSKGKGVLQYLLKTLYEK